MLGQYRFVLPQQAKRIFDFGTQRQNSRCGFKTRRQRQRHGGITPPPPHHLRLMINYLNHGIIHPIKDIPIVEQEQIRHAGEFFQRAVVADALRFTTGVAGGHHQRSIKRFQ